MTAILLSLVALFVVWSVRARRKAQKPYSTSEWLAVMKQKGLGTK